MGLKAFIKVYFPIIVISILMPVILDTMINNGILTFSVGAVDTWIGFWGSYIGALIGASVVYFVAIIQIKDQSDKQKTLLELRAKYEMTREMRLFYTTNFMYKFEEFIDITDKLLDYIQGLYISMLKISLLLTDKEDSDDSEILTLIKDEQSKGNQYCKEVDIHLRRIDHLAYYIPLDNERLKIINHMHELVYEYKNIGKKYEEYLDHFAKDPERVGLSGKAKEAGDEIYSISQDLRLTLTVIQNSIFDVDEIYID